MNDETDDIIKLCELLEADSKVNPPGERLALVTKLAAVSGRLLDKQRARLADFEQQIQRQEQTIESLKVETANLRSLMKPR